MSTLFIKLLYLELTGLCRKFFFDFGRELTVLICSLVLMGLFFYVFNDLVDNEVNQLSETLKENILKYLSLFITFISCHFVSSYILKIPSWNSFNARIGTPASLLWKYRIFRAFLLFFIIFFILYLVVSLYIYPWNLLNYLLVYSILIFILLAIKSLIKTSENISNSFFRPSLVGWRLNQIFFRNRAATFCLILAVVTLFLCLYSFSKQHPLIISLFLCFICGFFIAISMAIQLAVDISHAWLERNSGISHEEFLKTYTKIGLYLYLPFLLLITLGAVFFSPLNLSAQDLIKLGSCLYTPIFIYPSLAFILDAKRAFLQVAILFLLSLFIITTIYIHILGIALIFFASYTANQQQFNFYYRA